MTAIILSSDPRNERNDDAREMNMRGLSLERGM
jgi:hypothetical protein